VFAASWLDQAKDFVNTLSTSGTDKALSTDEIILGLKEALKVGSESVVAQLGQTDGFNADELIHIPLPEQLDTVKTLLDKAGFGFLLSDLELKLNRAAEAATPKAKALFMNAISEMSFDDVKNIYNGPDDAATQYFREKMSPALAEEMKPVIEDTLMEVGAVKTYDQVMDQYKSIPFVPDVKSDLTGHVIEKGMAGIFHYIAQEEAAIRQDPAKRTTEILKKVFNR
ncbi:MAG: DUF4197 domain-containing protein, partial [Desulfobacteraceae bacterium]